MQSIARNGLFLSISSNQWQKRHGFVVYLCLLFARLCNGSVSVFSLCICFKLLSYTIRFLQYGLELIFVKNSHEFVHEYLKKPEYVELMRRLGALGDGNQDQSKFDGL